MGKAALVVLLSVALAGCVVVWGLTTMTFSCR